MSKAPDLEQKSADLEAFGHYLRTGERLTSAEWKQRTERKFNPYHDPENGQFTSGPGGSAMISRRANDGKPYPARIDLRNGTKPYPVRNNLPAAAPATSPFTKAPSPRPIIRFRHSAGLDLPPAVVAKTNVLADSIATATGHHIHITSGRRAADRQAAAMYNNYADGTPPHYANIAAEAEVRAAFLQGRKARKNRDQIVSDMTNVLIAQTKRNIFISRHMRSGAIDIRTPPAAVLRAIRSHPSVQSVGVENDHIHIQFR